MSLLVAAPPVWAVDGVTEINQTTITASGGFPYSISTSGSYRLTSNVTVPDVNTTAIVITAPGVTLDLNGFAILGPVTCSGDGTTRYQNTRPASRRINRFHGQKNGLGVDPG
jgi:hypothetical protein